MLRPEHPIFEKPFPVALVRADGAVKAGAAPAKLEATPTPDNFKKWQPGIADTIETFGVFAKPAGESEPGLVTSNMGFEDAPDAERILGGINMKGPQYAAVARHGSIVMWGFHGAPDAFTDAGRRLFLNSIAYAVAHKGEFVETLRTSPERRTVADALFFWLSFYPEKQQLETVQRNVEGETVPPELLKDRAAAERWLAEREPYFRPAAGLDYSAEYKLRVDAECKAWGVPNGSPAFLDALAAHLRADPKDAAAGELLLRYVPGVTPERFAAWLEANRANLYFTETGGYLWRVRGTPAEPIALRNDAPRGPGAAKVSAQCDGSKIKITLRVPAPWKIARPAAASAAGAPEPLSLHILDGSAFAPSGEQLVEGTDAGDGVRGYVTFTAPVRRVAGGSGLKAELRFQLFDGQKRNEVQVVHLVR